MTCLAGRLALALLLAAAASIVVTSQPPASGAFFQRGVNLTAEWPDVYDAPAIATLLDELHAGGVNAVALVPYGFTPRDTPLVRFGGKQVWEKDESIVRVAGMARARGMKVLLKPQIWVSRGYPGDLDFADPAPWFAQYERFLEHYARLAARSRADLFCVGVEFSRLAKWENHWRRMIAIARRHYRGPLVYAANFGPEFESIRFWDALDYIGLNNYYPLPDSLSTVEVVAKVETVQRRYRRPVIFPEAGFPSLTSPHRQPWDETPRRISLDEQARCYEAILRGFYHKPWFMGVYWWKVGTNRFGGPADGSHTPWRKPAMDVVTRWYRSGLR